MTWILLFLAGSTLLVYSAEKLIGHLVGVASGLRVSVFLLAIVFTGIEFDDVFLGVVLNVEDLDDVAMGVILGTAISMAGIVLALAAILTPTKVSIPRDYLAIFAITPLVMIVFAVRAPLGVADGIALLSLFGLFIAYVAVRETTGEIPVFRDAELYEAYEVVRQAGGDTLLLEDTKTVPKEKDFSESMPFTEPRRRPRSVAVLLGLLALTGLIVGAATTGMGIEGILETYELEGTLFGATIATAVLTVEDIFLTVEPARKGAPEIGVGNVIGSVIFSVTGKLGIILLAGGLVVESGVLNWHIPALVVLTVFAAYVLLTGNLKRWHGYVLLTFYVLYWVVSFVKFGSVPVAI